MFLAMCFTCDLFHLVGMCFTCDLFHCDAFTCDLFHCDACVSLAICFTAVCFTGDFLEAGARAMVSARLSWQDLNYFAQGVKSQIVKN